MLKRMRKQLKNEKGLTLVELLAVIVILGIIAAIAVPAIGGVIENSKYSAVKADAMNAIEAANLYFIDNPDAGDTDTVSVATLKSEGYLESVGKIEAEGDTQSTIKNSTPRTITTGAIKYSGSKTVTFTNASIEKINDDDKKGSSSEEKIISGAVANP